MKFVSKLTTVEQFAEIAAKEGFQVSKKQAEIVFGYMEGHDYVLGLDETGRVIRSDLSHEASKEYLEEYSIREAILFACDMCADLLEDSKGPDEWMASLREDDEVLTPLYEAAMNPRKGNNCADAPHG